jgi:uncharacterized protein (DUF3820 family)
MPDINDIHKFYEANIPGYQRSDILKLNKAFLKELGYSEAKPIKNVLIHFEKVKQFAVFEWQGEEEIRTTPEIKQKMDTAKFDDKSPMPYGIHKGEKMANVPAAYLLWLLDNNRCSGEVKNYIQKNKNVLQAEVKRQKK